MIVFPHAPRQPEGEKTEKADEFLLQQKQWTITWAEAEKTWRQVVPGTDQSDMEKQALLALEMRWRHFTGQPDDPLHTLHSISLSDWKVMARQVIIDQLSMKSGLQLKSFTKGGHVFCRIRAPIKLLELQAKREGYRLQFRGEIDPGSKDFWNVEVDGKAVELEEERKKYSREEANLILSKLHNFGKISVIDQGVNIYKETQAMWSRRVHALERIADRVPVYTTYAAYAPFTSEAHMRYLFQTYPSVRGRTLFRAKDRLYLTKAIIDRYFDMGLLIEARIVDSFMALHDANRGERLTIDVLQRRWIYFWLGGAKEVGSPLVTDDAYEEEYPVSWYLRPFSQPLTNVREYFGEKVALHYAWIGCYTYSLVVPAFVGFVYQMVAYGSGFPTVNGWDVTTLLFLVFMVAWSETYREFWGNQEKAIALKWGTSGFVGSEKDRPQFKGDPVNPFARSHVHNRRETFFPEEKRNFREALSLLFVFCSVSVLILLISAVYYLEYYLTIKRGYIWGSDACGLLSAVQIFVLSFFYGQVAQLLNDWENHRTQTAFEDNLIIKTFLFEVFNSFGALLYTSFFKGPVFDVCTKNNCMKDLQDLLLSIYVVRYST